MAQVVSGGFSTNDSESVREIVVSLDQYAIARSHLISLGVIEEVGRDSEGEPVYDLTAAAQRMDVKEAERRIEANTPLSERMSNGR